ncbi:MAG: MBL fold metallo-hydrolase [Methanobacterium sp.]|nr:MBL fold metallo-hydrolase [Methanobacterium sp.]
MIKIDFYGGVDEIGGNKILINDNKTSFFLDFGMSFSKSKKFFWEFMQPRKANGLLDFFELGLLPKIEGIYREDYLRHSGMEFTPKPSVDGFFITHAHMDHSVYIQHLREDVPIYMTEETKLILEVVENTSKVLFADLINLKKDFHFIPKKRIEGYKRLYGESAKVERNINVLDPYKKQEIGNFKIESVPVDHSLPGATGFIVEGDEDTIAYTGDLRFNGRNPDLTQKFVKKCKKANPTVMISEGTRIDEEEKTITENEVEQKIIRHIGDYKGFIMVDYPIRDLDRLLSFYNAAKEADRTLVVNLKQAYMLKLFEGRDYPEIGDVAIYIPKRGWGLYGEESFACFGDEWRCASDIEPYHVKTDYEYWEREIMDWDNTITYKELKENPEEYIFRCDFFELRELIDIKHEEGLFIRSLTEPFDEETEIDFGKAQNWINHFNLEMHQIHASGHANGPEILDMIKEIEPEKVYPVHTVKKEKFDILNEYGIDVIYPKLTK